LLKRCLTLTHAQDILEKCGVQNVYDKLSVMIKSNSHNIMNQYSNFDGMQDVLMSKYD